ncbi:hypothetical protein Clacol_009004 [Clathrus columnatus]|uniref:Alpha-type protein kinase domain-containing protein n=1 Tax=Clathrus columnatus TaxID=1419009 RepID=A0AAV5ALU6_9AGAM|nr:hypothetical protein Clacol_009004 [Clathrus columnatus]
MQQQEHYRQDNPSCGYCIIRSREMEDKLSHPTLSQHIKDRMQEPINTRAPLDHNRHAMPLPLFASINPVEQNRTDDILATMARSYIKAKNKTNDPQMLQTSMISSTIQPGASRSSNKGVPATIKVSVGRILLQMGNKYEKVDFTPRICPFSSETSWSEVVSMFTSIVCHEVKVRCRLTVDITRISLCNLQGTTTLHYVDEWTTKTLKYLCHSNVALTLEETAEINLLHKELRQSVRITSQTPHNISDGKTSLTSFVSSSTPIPYLTEILHSDSVLVERMDITLGPDSLSSLTKSREPFKVQIGSEIQAHGSTKHMFRAILGSQIFAAKSFFNLDDSNNIISNEDNFLHLKKELARHVLATKIGEEFIKLAKSSSVIVSEFTFSDSWIAVVKEGVHVGWSYLMAPMIKDGKPNKFSGSRVAGAHNTPLGCTMDALAHFSLLHTNDQVVLTDIQGQSGIGDAGIQGIEEFKAQHKCNYICQKLSLKTLTPEAPIVKRSRAFSSSSNPEDNGLPFLESPSPLTGTPFSSTRKCSRVNSRSTSNKDTHLSAPPSRSRTPAIKDGTHIPQTTPDDSTQAGKSIYDVEITVWGLGEDVNAMEGEVVPKKGEERKGTMKISIRDGTELLDTLVSPEYMQGFALAPYNEILSGADILDEMKCFYELERIYDNFRSFAEAKNVQIAELCFDYKLIRLRNESGEPKKILEYLWSPVSSYSDFFFSDLDCEYDNYFINETLSALSHFLYQENQKNLVHTSWGFMRTDVNVAQIIAVTTHDQRILNNDDECNGISHYAYDIGTTGIDFWRGVHTCFPICNQLGLLALGTND